MKDLELDKDCHAVTDSAKLIEVQEKVLTGALRIIKKLSQRLKFTQ